jgi:hypothetical protein
MVAEIQKLEAAARIAMGSFEGNAIIAASAKPVFRLSYLTYVLLALAVAGMATALL